MARKRFSLKYGFWQNAARLALIGIGLALLAVTALTLSYRFAFVHPVSTLMLHDKITQTPYKRQWVSLRHIAPSLVYSVMMAEDARFCAHSGVDWQALQQAAADAALEDDDRPRGASTITMQVVKNLFFWKSRSYLRKATEIPIALWVSALLPKKRIMEIYLNIAQWGKGIYGAEAASRRYFGISAADLTPRQSALLAIALPSPLKRNPFYLDSALLARAAIIERRVLAGSGYIGCLR